MPTTLEDTVEFQAITLNDLLEADAKAGVGPVGVDEGKYKTWFMLSSAAAAIFALLFIGALVTGGGGGGGDDSVKGITKPPELKGATITTTAALPPGIKPGAHVSVSKGNEILVPSALVLNYKKTSKDVNGAQGWEVQLAVTDAEQPKILGLRGGTIGDEVTAPSTTATTATTVPAGTPAGESPTPPPATAPSG